MNGKQGVLTELPVGYRFKPTEAELVTHYLKNKVDSRPIPAQVVQDIDASELYSKPPNSLVQFTCDNEREWFFFIHEDESFHSKSKTLRIVGDGKGFWRSIGDEMPIHNSDGNVFAFKIHFSYFSGSAPNAKKTHWKMEEYRLPIECYMGQNFKGEKWVLGRMKRGMDYSYCF